MARKANNAANAAPEGESKADAFKRLGSKRVAKAIVSIRTVGKLASKTSYQYTKPQADKIVAALQAEVDAVAAQFESGTVAKDGVTFDL